MGDPEALDGSLKRSGIGFLPTDIGARQDMPEAGQAKPLERSGQRVVPVAQDDDRNPCLPQCLEGGYRIRMGTEYEARNEQLGQLRERRCLSRKGVCEHAGTLLSERGEGSFIPPALHVRPVIGDLCRDRTLHIILGLGEARPGERGTEDRCRGLQLEQGPERVDADGACRAWSWIGQTAAIVASRRQRDGRAWMFDRNLDASACPPSTERVRAIRARR